MDMQLGMNTDVVRQIGRDLRNQGVEVSGVVRRVDGLISQTRGSWQGPKAREFVSWWQQQHRPRLIQLAEALDVLGQSALRNADEQESVSSRGCLPGASPHPVQAFYDFYKGLREFVSPIAKEFTLSKFGIVITHNLQVEGTVAATPLFGYLGKAFAVFGIATGGVEVVQGSLAQDPGKTASGAINVALPLAAVTGGTATVAITAPLMVAKAYFDATVPYSNESMNSLLDYKAKEVFHTDRSHLTPAQSAALNQHYEGPMGIINKISDKMDQTAEPIRQAGDWFFRKIGLKK